MKNLCYKEVSNSFLVKNIQGIEINITRRNNQVKSITGYKNNEIIEIPKEIIEQIKKDINQAL
jgi:hypothetical protein